MVRISCCHLCGCRKSENPHLFINELLIVWMCEKLTALNLLLLVFLPFPLLSATMVFVRQLSYVKWWLSKSAWSSMFMGFFLCRDQNGVDFKKVDAHVHQLKGSSSRYEILLKPTKNVKSHRIRINWTFCAIKLFWGLSLKCLCNYCWFLNK